MVEAVLSTLESTLEQRFVRVLKKELGLTSAKMVAVANRGWPDRCIPLPNGKTAFIELKAIGQELRLSPHQVATIAMLKRYGVPVLVTSSVREAIDFLIREMQHEAS